MTTPVSSMVLVLVASLIGSLAAVLLKAGADKLHRDVASLKRSGIRLAAGIALFLASSVLYVWGIKDGSLTVLYPLLALGYVWTLVWSNIFFGEPFNKHKICGLGLVLLGVTFIAAGNG
jgi:drug/metabolite transporter (DMT)-like permease